MSAQAQILGRICPNCGAEPQGALPGNLCAMCGTRLIEVRQPSDPLLGRVIDERFEIREKLGQGGMGSVYRALQRSVAREVAIKIIDPRYASDAMGVRRFLREARLASQVAQQNTVGILDFGQSKEGELFIAMELVRGRTLADVIEKEGPFSVGRAARIAVQLCDALQAAHELSILHRDLKPSNIMVLDEPPGKDRIKILDFGLAKSLSDDESQTTGVGMMVGTPGYMAPELLKGAGDSPQTDLYAVGVMLGEMVAGHAVFDGGQTRELQAQQARGMPARLRVPPGIKPLVDRLLSPAPERRPKSAADLRALLAPLVESGERAVPTGELRALEPRTPPRSLPTLVETRRPTPPAVLPPQRRWGLTVGVVGAVLAVAFVIAGLRRDRAQSAATAEEALAAAKQAAAAAARAEEDLRAARREAELKPPPAPLPYETREVRPVLAAAAPVPEPVVAPPPVAQAAPVIAPPPVAQAAPAPLAPEAAPPGRVVLHLDSRPPNARVKVNGAEIGVTPSDAEVPRGLSATLEFSFRDGRTVQKVVSADREQDVTVLLPPPPGPNGEPPPFVRPGERPPPPPER